MRVAAIVAALLTPGVEACVAARSSICSPCAPLVERVLGGPPSPPNHGEGWRSRRFDLLSKAENTILHGNFTLFTRKKACIFLSWIPKPTLTDIDQRSVPQENCLFRQFFYGAEKEKREKKKEKKEKKKEKKREKRKRKKREKREKKREKRKRKRRKK